MRILPVIVSIAAFACRDPNGEAASVHDADGPPVSISLTLDRTTVAATDELTGTLHVEDRAPPRDSGEAPKAWCALMTWRLELANESTALLDLVVDEGVERWQQPRVVSEDRIVDLRFRIIPCPALLERSRTGAVPLRNFDLGNHALRVVLDAFDPGAWTMASVSGPHEETLVPLQRSFASRWIPFDVDLAGRPLDAADAEALVQTVEERRAGAVLGDFARRQISSFDRCLAAVARAAGSRRGRLAEACVTECGRSAAEALDRLAPLFAPVDEGGLDWSSHEAPPCFVRLSRGRVVPVRVSSSTDYCITFLYSVDRPAERWFAADGNVEANETAALLLQPKDTSRISAKRGLFRADCHTHHRTWGWLLIE